MERFLVDIQSPYWWLTALATGLIGTGFANWALAKFRTFVAWNQAASEKSITADRRKLAKYVVYCHNDPSLAPMLAARNRLLMIRGVLSAALGILTLFAIDHPPPSNFPAWLNTAMPWLMYPVMGILFLGAYMWVSDAVFSGRVFEAYTDDLIRAGKASDAEIDDQLAKKLPVLSP